MIDRISINPSSEVPLFRQLVEQIKGLISAGHLKSGESMPSVRALAKSLGVNPMTISKAISQLTEDGWLNYRRGQPCTVATDLPLSPGSDHWVTEAIVEVVMRAKQLGLDKEHVGQILEHVWKEGKR